jgi:hypothetical protein|tara:strand:+ start:2428 stop:2736 length:309 start_codon:yes stop_codon:yes gene_type:complete
MKQIFNDTIPFFESWIKMNLTPISHKKYCLSIDIYNHLILKKHIQQFIVDLEPYYIKEPLIHITYGHFLKIIRYICKQNKVTYEYKTKYIGSSYSIEYYLTF